MSERNPVASLPLFASVALIDHRPAVPAPVVLRLTPTEHGGMGAEDARRHAVDHAPGWLLERLGDALLSLRGQDFTSDDVRRIAGATVEAWLEDANVPERRNCFSGWWRGHARLHRLVRVGSVPSQRANARGRYVSQWRFPR